jgi:hypothetical protein
MSQVAFEETEIITRLIASVAPVIMTESSALSGLSAEEVKMRVIEECTFDPEYIDPDDLTPIQNLKLSLIALYGDVVDDIIAEVKSAIKDELRMEMFLELQKMHEDMRGATASERQVDSQGGARGMGDEGVLPKFSLNIDWTKGSTSLSPVLNGFESIAETMQFGETKTHPHGGDEGRRGRPTETTRATTAAESKARDYEKELEKNPLFACVSKNLSRAKSGQAMYTVDEIINSREKRFDEKTLEQLAERKKDHDAYLIRTMKYKTTMDNDDDDAEETARWDKLFAAKFNADR